MIKKVTLIISILFFSLSFSQENKKVNKDKNGYLIGIATKETFQDPSFKPWFENRYNSYKTDPLIIAKLTFAVKDIKIRGYMGTWCADSRREVPRFFKIFDEINFDENNLELIGVDRTKNTPDNKAKELDVFRVPTFIFYKNGKEIDRFVEYPRESIEKDILKIVIGEPYKHSYDRTID